MNWCLLAIAACSIAIAQPASACFLPESETALIHSALPSLVPPGAIALEVDIDTGNPGSLYREGLRADVRRVVHGDWVGNEVILRSLVETSCDAPFANGASGLIIGYLTEDRAGQFFSPILAQRGDGFRVPAEPYRRP